MVRALRGLGLCALLAGMLLLGSGGWIWSKAWLAQLLLERSWQIQLRQGDSVAPPPWPWADTHPVARLLVPDLGVSQLVLAGDSGRTLAFGPGLSGASGQPGGDTPLIISGHRDTHFRFLQYLQTGMPLQLETAQRRWHYRIATQQVIDLSVGPPQLDAELGGLLLVTCYPFDALDAGGSLRLLVWAAPDEPTDAELVERGSTEGKNRRVWL